MASQATRRTEWTLCALATCVLLAACKKSSPRDPGPDLQIVSEALRVRASEPFPRTSPFFDGQRIKLVAGRGETLAFHVLDRKDAPTSLIIKANGVTVKPWATRPVTAKRSSTRGMYGATEGTGAYLDAMVRMPTILMSRDGGSSREEIEMNDFFEVVVARDADVGTITGNLVVDQRWIPVDLTVVDVTLPEAPPRVWAYYDPRELAWAKLGNGSKDAPSEQEKKCIAMFRDYGVVLSPDIPLAGYAARKELLGDFPYVPVLLPKDPALASSEVKSWIDATKGTGKLPFAIPIDEPRKPDARAKVRELSSAVHAAGGGPSTFLYAVTAKPTTELGDAIDLFITLEPKRDDAFPRWTYNGAPPRAGSLLLDALSPGTRTWGWIGHRYNIPVWYVWDALYWHDRHNRKGAPLPGRALDLGDAISFDDGEDHGNLDGVLALPGDDATPCQPTLRLAAIRRGQQDRTLIDLAAKCDPIATAKIVDDMVPRALGDIRGKYPPGEGTVSWPTDDAPWEMARRKLLELAACKR
jgi:hypothetical protein